MTRNRKRDRIKNFETPVSIQNTPHDDLAYIMPKENIPIETENVITQTDEHLPDMQNVSDSKENNKKVEQESLDEKKKQKRLSQKEVDKLFQEIKMNIEGKFKSYGVRCQADARRLVIFQGSQTNTWGVIKAYDTGVIRRSILRKHIKSDKRLSELLSNFKLV